METKKAYMAQLLKVGITGTLPLGEVWSINPIFHLTTEPPVSWDDLNTVATAVNAISVGTNMKAFMSTETRVTGCKLEARNIDGELDNLIAQERSSAVTGTGTTPHPNQTSAVVSLRTVFPGGRGRGRLYWPATGISMLATTGRFNTGFSGTLAAEMKTYLSAIESAIQTTLGANDLVVWSRTGSNVHSVNRILVGDIPDTQRRRRDQGIETYSSVSYP